jgi:hypothetical protein
MRRAFSLLILTAILAGCSKKSVTTDTDGVVELSDPNAVYSLKFKEAEKGDKYEFLKARNATATVTVKNANTTTTQTDQFRFEYTEAILETDPNEPRPTMVSRVYKTAEKADPKGEMTKRSYLGKTVTIERYMKGYKYTVDVKDSLPVPEQTEMNQDFTSSNWKLDQNLPKNPVKVGDTWNVDFAAIAAIGGGPQTKYDKDKSKFTGKLAKVYKKDGRLWGVVELKINLVMDTVAPNGSPIKGEVNTNTTFEIVIDGSARMGTMKMTLDSAIDDRDVTGNERKTKITGTEERSVTPAKS